MVRENFGTAGKFDGRVGDFDVTAVDVLYEIVHSTKDREERCADICTFRS